MAIPFYYNKESRPAESKFPSPKPHLLFGRILIPATRRAMLGAKWMRTEQTARK